MSKRQRIPSPSESTISSSLSQTAKVTRIAYESGNNAHPLLCTLPPSCHRKPTPIANVRDLESHYATYHAHVCQEPGCSCVFPDARLLELHQTECHDPLAAIRKDKGEKIFACHLPSTTCNRVFQTPKARRLHLIQVHGYPKEYFFAVTNKGVGGLLKKWGEGASMIRGQWKPRENGESKKDEEDMQVSASELSYEDDEEQTVINEDETTEDVPTQQQAADDTEILADSIGALSLVPSSVRFGRGARQAGFAPNATSRGSSSGRGGRARPPPDQRMDLDSSMRGRGMPRGMLRVVRGGGGVPPRGISRGHPTVSGGRASPAGWARGRARGRGSM